MTLGKLYSLISQSGLVKDFSKISVWNDDPPLQRFLSELKLENYNGDGTPPDKFSGGVSLDPDLAKIKSVCEAFERFSLAYYKKRDFLKASAIHLSDKNHIISPKEFCFLTAQQKKEDNFKPFDFSDSAEFSWTSSVDLYTNKKVLIPAQLIFCPYNYDSEPVIMLPISTGAAFAESKEECLYKGICEVIERDAFITNYLFSLEPTKLSFESMTRKLKTYLDKFDKFKLKVNCYQMDSDIGVPTVMAIIEDNHSTTPAIAVGLKTELHLEKAIIGAIEEAFQVRNWLRYCLVTQDFRGKSYTDKVNLRRGLFWSNPRNLHYLNFFLNSKRSKKVTQKMLSQNSKVSPAKKLIKVIEITKAKNLRFFFKDITHPKILNTGVYVMKVISPDLHPNFLDEEYPYYGGSRLNLLKEKYGKQLNLIPHPFL